MIMISWVIILRQRCEDGVWSVPEGICSDKYPDSRKYSVSEGRKSLINSLIILFVSKTNEINQINIQKFSYDGNPLLFSSARSHPG